jgi:hypothetical protein
MMTYIAVASSADDDVILAAGTFTTRGAAEDAAEHYWRDGIGARHGYYAIPDGDTHSLPDTVIRAYRAIGAGIIPQHTCERCDGSIDRRNARILAELAPGIIGWMDNVGAVRHIACAHIDQCAEPMRRENLAAPAEDTCDLCGALMTEDPRR